MYVDDRPPSKLSQIVWFLVIARIHVLPSLTRLGIAYWGRLLLTEAGSIRVRPSRMCPLHPLSVFSISTRKISPGCNGFSLKATELAKLVVRTATVLSSHRRMFSPWMGWNLVTIFLDSSLMMARRRMTVRTPEEDHPRMTAPHTPGAYLILSTDASRSYDAPSSNGIVRDLFFRSGSLKLFHRKTRVRLPRKWKKREKNCFSRKTARDERC